MEKPLAIIVENILVGFSFSGHHARPLDPAATIAPPSLRARHLSIPL